MKIITLDIFGWQALIIEDNGTQQKYFINFIDGFYCLFVQRKKGKTSPWTKPKIIEKSDKVFILNFDEKKDGLKSKIVA